MVLFSIMLCCSAVLLLQLTNEFNRIRFGIRRNSSRAILNFTHWLLDSISIKFKGNNIVQGKFDDIGFEKHLKQYVHEVKNATATRIQAIARGKYARNLVEGHKNKINALIQSRLDAIERIRMVKSSKILSGSVTDRSSIVISSTTTKKKPTKQITENSSHILGGDLELDAYFQPSTVAVNASSLLFGSASIFPSVASDSDKISPGSKSNENHPHEDRNTTQQIEIKPNSSHVEEVGDCTNDIAKTSSSIAENGIETKVKRGSSESLYIPAGFLRAKDDLVETGTFYRSSKYIQQIIAASPKTVAH